MLTIHVLLIVQKTIKFKTYGLTDVNTNSMIKLLFKRVSQEVVILYLKN